VHRLARQQHDEVRDVDHVVDGPLAGRHQPRLQPRRRGRDLHFLELPGGEARAEVGRLDGDRHARDGVAGRVRVVRPRQRGQRCLRGGVDLAGEPVDGEAVRPVRRDLEFEHVRGDRQHVGQRRARRQLVVEDEDPVVLDADGELVLGEDHAVRLDAAELRALEPGPVGHDRARGGDGDELARGDVGRAADDRGGLARPELHRAHRQPVGVGVALGRQHAADAEVLERGDAVSVDALDLRPRHGQARGELLGGEAGVAEVVQPEEREPHPNCSRNRRSFS
jgi:hypothetical protein